MGRLALVIGALAAIVYPIPLQIQGTTYYQTVGFLVLVNAMLGVGWNVIGGWAGQFDFGPQVFFGVGAYTAALLYVKLGVDAWLGLLAGVVVAAVMCAVLTYPLTRLRGHYFAIATVAIWMIAQPIGASWEYIGGSQGLFIPIQPRAGIVSSALSLQFSGPTKAMGYYYAALVLFAITLALMAVVERSKLGYYFRAIRDDQEGAEGIGIDSRLYKVIARSITAAVFAAAGRALRVLGAVGLPRAGAGAELEHAADHGHGGGRHRPPVGPGAGRGHPHPDLADHEHDARHRPAGRPRHRPDRLRPHHRRDRRVPSHRAALAAVGALAASAPAGRGLARWRALLGVESSTKRFGGLLANRDVSLAIEPGEIVGLIGPNGAGKTTLFNCITGYMHPDAGRIVFDGHDVSHARPERICRLGVARTWQVVRAFGRMTALENVVCGALQRTNRVAEARARATELLEFTELRGRGDVPAATLTLADKKRLEIARALATRPRLLCSTRRCRASPRWRRPPPCSSCGGSTTS